MTGSDEISEGLKQCPCGIPTEALPIDTAYFDFFQQDSKNSGYILQRTCDKCGGTVLQPLNGSCSTILVQLLAANNLMTPDASRDGFDRRARLSEAVMRVVKEARAKGETL